MTDFVFKLLNKCRWAKLPVYDKSTTHLTISKSASIEEQKTLKEGKFYIIKIAPYITNPAENFTLASNWNNGVVPKSEYLRCQVQKTAGKMINVGGIGYDINKDVDLDDCYQSLWLPSAGITVISSLD